MKFNEKKSELVYEVISKSKGNNYNICTDEKLYRSKSGKYFMKYYGSKFSSYGKKIGYDTYIPQHGRYSITQEEIEMWKCEAINLQKKNPNLYEIIDWEKEKEDNTNYENFVSLNSNFEDELKSFIDIPETDLPF